MLVFSFFQVHLLSIFTSFHNSALLLGKDIEGGRLFCHLSHRKVSYAYYSEYLETHHHVSVADS